MDIMPNRLAKKNDVIFREGDKPDGVYYITSGRVRVCRTINGVQTNIAELEEGDVFGELAMIDDRPRAATIIASEDSSLYMLSRSGFENKLKGLDVLMHAVFLRMALSIRNMNLKYEELQRHTGQQPHISSAPAQTSPTPPTHPSTLDSPPFNDVSMIRDYIEQPRFR
jgi:CRP/FNR family cyclic AMP-dependent transcriptional regulator